MMTEDARAVGGILGWRLHRLRSARCHIPRGLVEWAGWEDLFLLSPVISSHRELRMSPSQVKVRVGCTNFAGMGPLSALLMRAPPS